MRAPDIRLRPMPGRRVVATPQALDAVLSAGWPEEAVVVLRTAPDEAVGVGARGPLDGLIAHDRHAIDVEESALAGCWLTATELGALVVPHLDWPLTAEERRPALEQGKVAGVPAKLWLAGPGDPRGAALLVVNRVYAAEIAERLGVAW